MYIFTKNTKMYIRDILYKIYEINTKQHGPARPMPGPSPGPRTGRPGTARPQAWAGLGPGRPPLGTLYLSCISWIYLGYLFWHYLVYCNQKRTYLQNM